MSVPVLGVVVRAFVAFFDFQRPELDRWRIRLPSPLIRMSSNEHTDLQLSADRGLLEYDSGDEN